jgi:hypothetical protein
MKERFALWFVPVLIAIGLLTSCGGGGSTGIANLQIQLTPPAPSLAVNSSVLISAQTEPSKTGYFETLTWTVQGFPTSCVEVVENPQSAPPLSPCPNGWLAENSTPPPQLFLGVYYYAPSTPGTYQVNVQGQITNDSGTMIVNQGSASATVTVTSQ